MTGSEAAPAVTVTLGRCDEMRAEVFLRVETCADVPQRAIAGTLTGPRRGRDTTLPVTVRLQPTSAPGLARAILTEPAYWTPDLPNLYRLEATVASGDSRPLGIDRLVGLRRLGVRGRSFWLDGHRWVPRAVPGGAMDCDLTALRAAAVAAVVADPPESLLAAADEAGVAIVAVAERSTAEPFDDATLVARIDLWAAHPSAALVVLPESIDVGRAASLAETLRPRKGTLLLGRVVSGAAPPPTARAAGCDFLVVRLDRDRVLHAAWRDEPQGVPLVASRSGGGAVAPDRRACDRLQAELSAWGIADGRPRAAWDWAGYLVT